MNARTKILRLSEESINECNKILNELFEDYNNTAPLKFEKIADSALKGEEKKKQMLNKQKEEDELFGR